MEELRAAGLLGPRPELALAETALSPEPAAEEAEEPIQDEA